MKRTLSALAASLLLTATSASLAATEYNTVPAGDPHYRQCLAYSDWSE
jgi:hypothetical protein